MRGSLLGIMGVVAGLAVAAPVQAQGGSPISVNRGDMAIVPYAGYMITSHFANGPLSTSLGTGNGAIYGAQLSLPLAPSASLVGGIGYSTGNLNANAPFLGSTQIGTAKAYIYEGDLELRGSQGKQGLSWGFTPFLQVGAGAIHRNLSAIGLQATSTDFAINGGVGADFAVSPGFALRLMAKDYVGKATFDNGLAQTNTLNNVSLSGGVRITF